MVWFRGVGHPGGPQSPLMARRACALHCAEPHMPAQCGTLLQGDTAASPHSGQGSAIGSSAALSPFPRLTESGHGCCYTSALGQSVGWPGGLAATSATRNRCLLRSNLNNYSIGYPTCLELANKNTLKLKTKMCKLLTN